MGIMLHWGRRTSAIMFVVKGTLHEGSKLLEIAFRLIQRVLDSSDLLKLIRGPVRLICEHENAQGVVDGMGDVGQERADGFVVFLLVVIVDVVAGVGVVIGDDNVYSLLGSGLVGSPSTVGAAAHRLTGGKGCEAGRRGQRRLGASRRAESNRIDRKNRVYYWETLRLRLQLRRRLRLIWLAAGGIMLKESRESLRCAACAAPARSNIVMKMIEYDVSKTRLLNCRRVRSDCGVQDIHYYASVL